MNSFDMLITVIIGFCLIRGVFRGVVKELSSIIGVFAGFVAAYSYYPHAADFLSKWLSDEYTLNILSFLIIFCAIFGIISLIGVLIKFVLVKANFGWADKACGSVIGLFKGIFISAILLIAFTTFLPQGAPFVEKSFFSRYLTILSEQMIKVVSDDMKYKFTANIEEFKNTWENHR